MTLRQYNQRNKLPQLSRALQHRNEVFLSPLGACNAASVEQGDARSSQATGSCATIRSTNHETPPSTITHSSAYSSSFTTNAALDDVRLSTSYVSDRLRDLKSISSTFLNVSEDPYANELRQEHILEALDDIGLKATDLPRDLTQALDGLAVEYPDPTLGPPDTQRKWVRGLHYPLELRPMGSPDVSR
jgi:hypothetical protein